MSLKYWIKRNFPGLVYYRKKGKSRKLAAMKLLNSFAGQHVSQLADASLNVFTYHGEDGIILYLLDHLKNVPKTFVDIGAGDCIKSNCANLAFHYDWSGVFIDAQKEQLAIGRQFYESKIRRGASLTFYDTLVTRENVNQVIATGDIKGSIGLLSIDIDGNDYWIWEAINVIEPAIVVIEAKVEFGTRSIAVPYGNENHHSANSMYNGASVEALRRLGLKKGYKLAGANKYGYNLFFVKDASDLPSATTESVLNYPETISSFYRDEFFEQHKFENIQ
jgi:hypothetical protein